MRRIIDSVTPRDLQSESVHIEKEKLRIGAGSLMLSMFMAHLKAQHPSAVRQIWKQPE